MRTTEAYIQYLNSLVSKMIFDPYLHIDDDQTSLWHPAHWEIYVGLTVIQCQIPKYPVVVFNLSWIMIRFDKNTRLLKLG